MLKIMSPFIEEPSPKIQKLGHNQVFSQNPLPLLTIKKLSDKAALPSRAFILSTGYDLSSAAEITVPARGKALVPADLNIGIPEGTYARVAPRSGLALKKSIDVGAGVIDAGDYRGPVGVVEFNHSAQLILQKIVTPEVLEAENLDFYC